MDDYKSEQDRFFDQLRDLSDFREADANERAADTQRRIDKVVNALLPNGFGTIQEAREWLIERMKERGKLPPDYRYPGNPSN